MWWSALLVSTLVLLSNHAAAEIVVVCEGSRADCERVMVDKCPLGAIISEELLEPSLGPQPAQLQPAQPPPAQSPPTEAVSGNAAPLDALDSSTASPEPSSGG